MTSTAMCLVFGPAASPMVTAIIGIGEELGLAMLPLLPTPFSDRDLHNRITALLNHDAPPSAPIDVNRKRYDANWLELWYQPKIEIRSFRLIGAEAMVRVRHPNWGIVSPAYFEHDDADPHFRTLADFLTMQAFKDWHYFAAGHGHVEISVNLPATFFHHPDAVDRLARQMPRHPAFRGFIIEINGNELVRNMDLAKQAARRLQLHNITMAVDDLGTEWPLLMELEDCPFAEIKVDHNFVTGSADCRLKQSVCHRILDLADGFGARTVAAGVKSRADFVTVRELGFDSIQGCFFAKPMLAHKFARQILGRPLTMPT